MAVRKTSSTNALNVVTSTQEEKKRSSRRSSANNVVYIACALPISLKFDDVDDGHGGFKSVIFPSVNDHLRGKRHGILLDAGNSVLVSIAKEDWECIKRKHGTERIFISQPPKLWEFKSEADYRAAKDETAEMKTGLEPVTPESAGVKSASESE